MNMTSYQLPSWLLGRDLEGPKLRYPPLQVTHFYLVDVARGANKYILAVKWGFQPLNHNKQTCKICPNDNHV